MHDNPEYRETLVKLDAALQARMDEVGLTDTDLTQLIKSRRQK